MTVHEQAANHYRYDKLRRTLIPAHPGYYWALWLKAANDTHEAHEVSWPAHSWEIVQVNDNNVEDPADDEYLSVSVPGVRETQWREYFKWGPFVGPIASAYGSYPAALPLMGIQCDEAAGAIIARIEIALNSALNMVEGDGLPPDWDYLRMVRGQLPELQLTAALAHIGVRPGREKIDDDAILKLLYASGLGEKGARLVYTKWKDSIDIDVPTLQLRNFVKAVLSLLPAAQREVSAEALGSLSVFAKAADNYADCKDEKYLDEDATISVADLRNARAALARIPAPQAEWRAPEGWQLVPKKLDARMLLALDGTHLKQSQYAQHLWDDVLSASPSPPLAEGGGYLIWSNEHRAWWRPNRMGYTIHIEAAGRYTREEAISESRVRDQRPDEPMPELPVREADALASLAAPPLVAEKREKP